MKARLILLLFLPVLSFAQERAPFYVKDYDWEAEPKIMEVPAHLAEEPEVIMKEHYVCEFGFDESGNFSEIRLSHRITHINSDEAIEDNNKVYLYVASGNSIIEQKARVIKANGKVVVMDRSSVKVSKDEQTGRSYEYFAIEDLEIGDQVETLNKLNYDPVYRGTIRYIQSSVPKLNYTFKIVSPVYLVFDYKGYNNFPGFELDTMSYDDKRCLAVEIPEVPKFKSEPSAYRIANYMKFTYKLEANTSTGVKNFVSYGDVSGRLFTNYTQTEKNDLKLVKKILKGVDYDKNASDEEKARAVELYIKDKYAVADLNIDGMSEIDFIYENKFGNSYGITKLYAGIFNLLEIPYEIAFTTDRTENRFDPEFEAYCFLEEVLIYFPGFDKYLETSSKYDVIGYLSPRFTYNNCLYVEELDLAGQKTGVPRIGDIPFLKSDKTVDDMKIELDLSEGFTDLEYKLHKEMTGYYAGATQPYYTFFDEEDLKNVNESHVKYISETIDIESIETQNTEWGDYGVKPLIVDATFTTDEFFEQAGNKYLFKVGLLIGPQMELYSEEKRTLPVEEDYCRKYHRTITFTLPEGYIVGNLKEAEIYKKYIKDGVEIMAFKSVATQNGNTVTIDIVEYYDELYVPVEHYEQYREVINAAADFNKVVLVIEQR
ncbi:DUF3857 domain-containing protein [bacterium]|nr:DUF3857 domain-containing protein [bacterium]